MQNNPAPPSNHFEVDHQELSRRRYAREMMTLCLIVTDLFSLTVAFSLGILIMGVFFGETVLSFLPLIKWLPGLLLFIFIYALSKLYPTVGMSPVDELALLTRATSTVFILTMALSFWIDDQVNFPALIFIITWPIALCLTQLDRWLLRILARKLGFWGEAAAVIGTGPQTQYLKNYIRNSIRLGIRPVAFIDGDWTPDESLALFLDKTRIRTAFLVMNEISEEMKERIISQHRYVFHRLIMISPLEYVYSLGVSTYDLEGILGLEVRQNLLNRWERFYKRCIDLVLIIVGGILVSPLLLVIAALIRLDGPGKIFYKQERIGVGGEPFKIWKFRTMIPNADQALQAFLASDPVLKAEWEANQKLKNDPRVTRIGKILRKLSLDELPQLWNILIGEMSIVGPRPIMKDEVEHYHQIFQVYKLVRPGLTGMWQVSGRSDCTYEERVRYDEYYIRNWSVWLDIYIMIRTIFVLLSRKGSY